MTSHVSAGQLAGISASTTTVGPDGLPREVVIQTRGLTKTFRNAGAEVNALCGVDLDVERAQMLVLLGPSGCGKTTLLRCIGGLEHPTEGEISLAGRLFTSVSQGINLPPEKRNLGMMFQSFGLWPHMTVAENVAYPLQNQKALGRADIQSRVSLMLKTMGVDALGGRYPGQLSGGQQQRVALARALVASPTALLFDEPLSNVDAQVRKRLRDEIRQMKIERGFAGVYVTHDQEEAMALADVLAVMQEGRISQIGTPWEVYRRPRNLYVAHFVGEANTIVASVLAREGGRLVVETAIGRLTLADVGEAPLVGARGHVVLRPEDLRVGAVDVDASSRQQTGMSSGKVVNAVLLGPRVELSIAIGDIVVRAWTDSVAPLAFAANSPVQLDIAPASIAWIP